MLKNICLLKPEKLQEWSFWRRGNPINYLVLSILKSLIHKDLDKMPTILLRIKPFWTRSVIDLLTHLASFWHKVMTSEAKCSTR